MEHTLRLRKGAWTCEEDDRLRICIRKYGEGQWHRVPLRAGLNRCRKSCRLRWLNYLKPNIKRGDFSVDEVDLIIRLHKLLGNRWALIAGRLPGRTANDVKNYWNTHLKKQLMSSKENTTPKITRNNILKPRPRTFSNQYFFWTHHPNGIAVDSTQISPISPIFPPPPESDDINESNTSLWWENLLDISNGDDQMKQLDKNGASDQETVTQQTETNAGHGSNDKDTWYPQDMSLCSDFCLDDVSFWDLLDPPDKDHVLI